MNIAERIHVLFSDTTGLLCEMCDTGEILDVLRDAQKEIISLSDERYMAWGKVNQADKRIAFLEEAQEASQKRIDELESLFDENDEISKLAWKVDLESSVAEIKDTK